MYFIITFFSLLDSPGGPRITSGRVIGLMQRPLPDNKQHLQKIDIYAPAEFEPAIPASDRLQSHALDRAVTGIRLLLLLLYPKSSTRQAEIEYTHCNFLNTLIEIKRGNSS